MNRKANCAFIHPMAITITFVFIFIFILIIVIIIITGKPYPDAVGTYTHPGGTPPGWGLSGLIWIII